MKDNSEKIVVCNQEVIDNANEAILMALVYKAEKFNCQYTLEDGKITEIEENDKIIKGGLEDVQVQSL